MTTVYDKIEKWAESIIGKLRADGVPTGEVETEFESMKGMYA